MRPVAFTLHAEDVGGTIAVELRLNDRPVLAYMPGTAHEHIALGEAEQFLGAWITEAFHRRRGITEWRHVNHSIQDIIDARSQGLLP